MTYRGSAILILMFSILFLMDVHSQDAQRWECLADGSILWQPKENDAESALYCRVMTEGLFGVRPTGFSSFLLTPRLPDHWEKTSLENIRAFNQQFDIEVVSAGDRILVKVSSGAKVTLKKKLIMAKP